ARGSGVPCPRPLSVCQVSWWWWWRRVESSQPVRCNGCGAGIILGGADGQNARIHGEQSFGCVLSRQQPRHS
ncbi:hypothetical protein CCUS01_13090, partial [Colletotrichum cuscutae]